MTFLAALVWASPIFCKASVCFSWRSSLLSLGLLAAVTKVVIEAAKAAKPEVLVVLKKLLFVFI